MRPTLLSLSNYFQWNFFDKKTILFLDQKINESFDLYARSLRKKQIIWEWRAFWSEEKMPISFGMNPLYLQNLSFSEKADFDDFYILLAKKNMNLKWRQGKLIYKPYVESYKDLIAFSHKKKFDFPIDWETLHPFFPRLPPRNIPYKVLEDFQNDLEKSGYQPLYISLQKRAYRYKIGPHIQCEWSQIKREGCLWHSICWEGVDPLLISLLAETSLGTSGRKMGYVKFLHSLER